MENLPEHLINKIISIIPRDRNMRSPTAALVREFISSYDCFKDTKLSFVEFFKYRDSIMNFTDDENDDDEDDDNDDDDELIPDWYRPVIGSQSDSDGDSDEDN